MSGLIGAKCSPQAPTRSTRAHLFGGVVSDTARAAWPDERRPDGEGVEGHD